jgi:Type II secretion system (T2SS), protein E, N-terminal domain
MGDEDRAAEGSGAGGHRGGERESEPLAGTARRPLASLLAEAGVASEEQLRLAVAEGMGSGERLGEIVLRRGWIDEAGLAQLLARQWGLVYLDDEAAVLDESASTLLPAQEAKRLGVCVIGFAVGLPLVALAEPAEERFAHVKAALGRECQFAVVSKTTLERLLAQGLSTGADGQAAGASAAAAHAAEDAEAERLLSELDTAAQTLLAWAERVRRVVELQQRTENQLSSCQEQIVALREDLASKRATIERLETELAHQHELVNAAKAKLAELARALEAE